MAVDISEIRPEELELVRQLQGADQLATDATIAGAHRLRLAARNGQKIVAALWCDCLPDGACVSHLLVDADSNEPEAIRQLLDKAMRKLQARGVHRCQFKVSTRGSEQPFWQEMVWQKPESFDDTEQVTRVRQSA